MSDYYEILGLSKKDKPSDSEIKKAYHRKAMKFHPDRMTGDNSGKKDIAEKKFKAISGAYQVLSDPEKKKTYDTYGLEGVKTQEQGGMPGFEGMGGFGGRGGFGRGGGFDRRGGIPFGSFTNVTLNGIPHLDDFFTSTPGFSFRQAPSKIEVEQPIYLSLEELYQGIDKKYRVTFQPGESKVYPVTIKPGWKQGTKITFREGPGHVTFIVQEKTHPRFQRQGNNLLWNCPVSAKQSKKRLRLTIKTLDGRNYTVETKPPEVEGVHVVSGEGMPYSGGTNRRGNILIQFQIK